MKIFLATMIFCLCWTLTAKAAALDKATKKNLDAEISAMIGDSDTKVPSLGVVVFKDGKKVYSHFDGRRHINADKPVTEDTLFRVASLSKMFTAFTIMQLVEQGKINLHDDASKYLGFELRNPNFPDEPITVEMLLDHTSSIRDGTSYLLPPQYTLKEFFATNGVAYGDGAHFASDPIKAPGKFFSYCNFNYGVLGTIIECVTGERFDIYQQNHILKQLKIGGGYVVANFDEKTFSRLGTLYLKNDGGKWNEFGEWHAWVDDYKVQPRKDTVRLLGVFGSKGSITYDLKNYKVGTNATIFEPQGGLRASFNDLSNALEMLMNRGEFRGEKVLSEESVEEILRSHWIFDEANPNGYTFDGVMENYGLGTYKIFGASKARLCKDFDVDLVGHSGEAYGMISGLYFIPNTRDGVIFMINGRAIPIGDKRSFGKFSAGYIWEENVMDPVCRYILAK